jgi:hypothetical protein
MEIPQKVWRQYREGDTEAFARHIVRASPSDWSRKVAARFETDATFRETAITFIAHFEGVMRQAMEGERTDTLSASLLSSDMGKLYVVLARAINRLK